jgi:hypothetical protein
LTINRRSHLINYLVYLTRSLTINRQAQSIIYLVYLTVYLPKARSTMLRIGSLFVIAASALAASLPSHVLFIVVDDLGFSDLGYKKDLYNITGPIFPTPTLDALALAGVRLESIYVHALCSPSRGAFLSGRYAFTTGGNAEVIVDGVPDQLPTNIRTIADLLKTKNWATAAFGKCALSRGPHATPRRAATPDAQNPARNLISSRSQVGRRHDDVGVHAALPRL